MSQITQETLKLMLSLHRLQVSLQHGQSPPPLPDPERETHTFHRRGGFTARHVRCFVL
jgi:hypothetical protein